MVYYEHGLDDFTQTELRVERALTEALVEAGAVELGTPGSRWVKIGGHPFAVMPLVRACIRSTQVPLELGEGTIDRQIARAWIAQRDHLRRKRDPVDNVDEWACLLFNACLEAASPHRSWERKARMNIVSTPATAHCDYCRTAVVAPCMSLQQAMPCISGMPIALATPTEVADFFPGRPSWKRLLKLFTRRPSHGYDHQYYDAANGTYGGYVYDGRYADAAKRIINHFGLEPGAEVLEVGCAKGFILVELQRLGMRVTGLEVSEYAQRAAHPEVQQHIHIWRGSSLPFSAHEFDLVLCKEALPHMDNPALMIEQIARVGKQSHLIIQVAETWLQRWLMKMWDPTHVHCQPAAWWRKVLEEQGYSGSVTFKRLF